MGDFLVYSKDSKEVSEAEWSRMTGAGNEVREKFQITYVIERALMFPVDEMGSQRRAFHR